MQFPEPIAIIGMACRFAGGIDSPEEFWTLLSEGRDTIGELPPGRWDWYATKDREHALAVREVTKRGAFLDDIKGFDAEFFDITPREAALMDPQQRIVLELAWEALEHAGIRPADLGGTDTGVFIGVGSDDYGRRLLEDLPRIEAWTGIGGAYCGVPNRVSYTLDLHGPSVAVDTACSSSLVAMHLAAQALRAGECPVALAGGVMVMAAPGLSIVLDAAGAVSPDGRSKSFDADADGYGRGEGGGVMVLKRLSDARRDGDRVLAVIRGSAVHQDGRTNGIMAPNSEAQAHLLRRAYQAAGIDPATVSYVEAHGTGTRAGDPMEASAITAALATGRPADRPLLIGSVKPNVGHLEAGAGVAGVIKTVLSLRHGEIPPSLNFSTPTPAISWDRSGLRVVTERTEWAPADEPRRAGVSGYGYGGTIAHVILEEGDRPAGRAAEDGELSLYPLSGASEPAVREYAGRLARWLASHDEVTTADVGLTLACRRTHLPHRAAVLASSREQLIKRLRELTVSGVGSSTGTVLEAADHGMVWVFSGHGSQWRGMARELLASDPAFEAVIAGIEPVFVEEIGISPREEINSEAIRPVSVIQPMIFAVQTALAAVWKASGLRPDAVIGHSVGEIAAAVTAGVLTLEQGARLVCRRSALLDQVAGRGAMAMVNLSQDEAERRLASRSDVVVAIAASPASSVISGEPAAIAEISEAWRAQGLSVRAVDSDVAFHSPQMEPLLASLAAAAADLPPRAPDIRIYSTALADPRSDAPRDGAYWAANLRDQVRFSQAVAAAVEDGYRLFTEVSPHPVVEHSISETLEELGADDAYITHSLRRNKPERETLLANLGSLYCHGANVDWSALWRRGSLADLPGTAWQRKPHWAEAVSPGASHTKQHDPAGHTLLGGLMRVQGTTAAQVWLTYLDRECRPYPGDHPVRGVEIIPAAVLISTFMAAASHVRGWSDLTDVDLRVPVSLSSPRDVQVVLQDGTIRLSSRIADGSPDTAGWATHTTAAVEPASELDAARGQPVAADSELPVGYVVERLASLGVAAMGFPWAVDRLLRGDGVLVATVRAGEPGTAAATWAPILDAALSTASVAFTGAPTLRMPAHIQRVTLRGTPPAQARVTVWVTGDGIVDVEITSLDGVVLGRLSGLQYGVLESEEGTAVNPRRLVHEITWRPPGPKSLHAVPAITLVGPDTALLGRLSERLGDAGIEHHLVTGPEELREAELTGDHGIIVVPAPGRPGELGEAAARAASLLARTAQRLAASATPAGARLWCVTQGVRESADERSLGHAALWGLGRIIGGEHPELWGGVIDIGQSPLDVPALIEVLRAVRGEDVIVVRDGQPSVPRLRHLDGEPVRPPISCQPDGTYLITGGLGSLGLKVAHWMADRGMRRAILAGRRALPPRQAWDRISDPRTLEQVEAVRSLERAGVTVVTVAVDIAEADETARLLSPGALGLPPIRGVIHAAGVVDNGLLHTLTEESLRKVLRPKVDGALVLHELFPPRSVDFFVLFSSSGQLLGLPGQASYAAGNAFLDALAAHRRAAGDVMSLSLGWTSWRGLGMSTSSAAIDAELAAHGTASISLPEAFGAWEFAERRDTGYVAVFRTIPLEPGERRPPLLSELDDDQPGTSAAAEPVTLPWAGLDGAELRSCLIDEVSRHVAAETQLSVTELDPRRALVDMGIDSVMTVRIRRALERRLGLRLPATVFWDWPTIDAVVSLLTERVARHEANPAA
jgi:6-methylsalicylic acid synthase